MVTANHDYLGMERRTAVRRRLRRTRAGRRVRTTEHQVT